MKHKIRFCECLNLGLKSTSCFPLYYLYSAEDLYQMTVVWMTQQVSLSRCQEDSGEEKEALDPYFAPLGPRLRRQPIMRPLGELEDNVWDISENVL